MFVVLSKMGEEKGDAGVFEVVISIVGVILGWIGQEGRFWRENRVECYYAA